MTLDDVVYAINNANRQARSPLVAVREQPFSSGTIAAGGTDITITLPKPSAGFIRRWEWLHAVVSTFAAGDILFFSRISTDFTVPTVLWAAYGYGIGGGRAFPLIGGRVHMGDTAIGMFQGIDPFWCAPEDNLIVFMDFTAPAAQTVAVSGWYKDLPV